MVWTDTDKFKEKHKNKKLDTPKLERWNDEGWQPKLVDVPKFIERIKFARPVKLVAKIDPRTIIFDNTSCMNCTACGMYNRHPFCNPDSPSLEISKGIIQGYESALLFVTQNDGNDPWDSNPLNLKHIDFHPRVSFGLRGAEAGTSRYLQRTMKQIQHLARKIGYSAQSFVTGKCELCGRCPLRDLRNTDNKQVPCILGGMPSLEAWKMNVYRWYSHGSLKDVFNEHSDVLRPFKFICDTHLTLITLLVYDHRERLYWYDEHVKKMMKENGTKECYKKNRLKIEKSTNNRKAKGIPR